MLFKPYSDTTSPFKQPGQSLYQTKITVSATWTKVSAQWDTNPPASAIY